MLLLHVLGFTSVALAAVSSSSCQTISLSTSTSDIKTYWNTQTTTAYKSYISKYQETITTTLPDKTTTAANTITTTIGTVTSSASIISATATATIYSKTVAYKTGTISKVSTITNTLPQTLPTTTIAPSPGFTAIGPYLRAQGHSASLSRQDPAKRAVPFGEDGSEAAEIERRQSPQFANFVLCDMYVQTVAPTSVTTTLAPKTVTAKGALVTVTGPDVTKKTKVTVSVGSTTTFVDTTTTTLYATKFASTYITEYTATTTTTVEQSQPTYYAACSTDNMVDTIDGGAFYQSQTYTWGSSFLAYQGSPAPQSAYDCCVTCLTMDPPCALAEWGPGINRCMYLPDNGTCTGDIRQAWFKANMGQVPYTVIFNSNCAEWDYLGLTGDV